MLYLHSYQSLVWNKMVSERLRSMDKANVLVGDLVIQRNDGDLMASYAGGDAAGGDATEKVQGAGRPKTAVQGRIEAVHLVDEKDIAENKYKMTDVVLPVPGRDVRFPAHKIEDAYKSMVEGDGVRFDKNPDFFPYLSGDYRYIIQKPVDVEHSIIAYNDHNDSLTETEMTTLREPVRDTRDPAAAEEGAAQNAEEAKSFKALSISFSLESSTYATMFLRELMKISMSFAYQVTLNEELKPISKPDAEVKAEAVIEREAVVTTETETAVSKAEMAAPSSATAVPPTDMQLDTDMS